MSDALHAAAFGYRFLFAHLPPLWALAAWRIAVTVAILLTIDLAAPDSGDPLADLQLAGKYLVLGLGRVLLYSITLSAVAVAWHRSAAGHGSLGRRLKPDVSAAARPYIATVATLSLGAMAALLLVWLGGNGAGRLIAGETDIFHAPISKGVFLGGLAVAVWAVARLVPAVSQAAFSGARPRYRQVWRRTAGHAHALAALLVVCIAPLSIAARLAFHGAASLGAAGEVAGRIGFELAIVVSLLIFLAALTRYDKAVIAQTGAST